MSNRMKATVDIELTLEQVAEWFWELDDDTQARFFVAVAEIERNDIKKGSMSQWYMVGSHLRNCKCSSDGARDIVRKHKWRGYTDWRVKTARVTQYVQSDKLAAKALWASMHIEDARAIASYLKLTRIGSFWWAWKQMQEGHAVERPGLDTSVFLDRVAGKFYHNPIRGPLESNEYKFRRDDFEATDWQIVEEEEG